MDGCADGLTPRQAVETACRAGQKEAVRLFEIMELNPPYDRDNQTATIIIAYLTGMAHPVKSVGVKSCK